MDLGGLVNKAAYIIGWIIGRVIAFGRVASDWFRDGFERGRDWLPLKPDPGELDPEPVETPAAAKLREIFQRIGSAVAREPEDPNDRYESYGYDRPNPPLPSPESNGDGRSVSAGDNVPTR